MPNYEKVPNKQQLEKYLKMGLTQQQIADRWERDSGVRVTRSAIANAIQRNGLKSNRPRDRYMNMIPWTLAPEHRNHADARLLRFEARRRQGKPLNDREMTWLQSWLEELQDKNAVIMYDPRWPEGFAWVPREDTDDDIIRRPAGK